MNIDLLFLTIVVFFTIVGYIRGFLNQLLSVILITCILLFAKPLAEWLKFDSNWKWFSRSSILVLWGTCSFVFFLASLGLGALVRYAKKDPTLSPIDKWIGSFFGFLKGAALVVLLGCLYLSFPSEQREHFNEIEKDAKNSTFVSISQSVLHWKSVSAIGALGDISKDLRSYETDGPDIINHFFDEPLIDIQQPSKSKVKSELESIQPWKREDKK